MTEAGESRFDERVLEPDRERRSRILPVLDAALDAVDPERAVQRVLRVKDNWLQAGDQRYDLNEFENCYLIGFGKATLPMARATVHVLGQRITAGLLVTKYGQGLATGLIEPNIRVLEADHPVPDEQGVAAARQVVDLARHANATDLVLCLISGGGSALMTLPADDLTLADLQETTSALLQCGASIDEINTLRKHLSVVKGGQLARLAAPATLISLVLSDVVGSPLDVIASGPAVPDSSTWTDAWEIVERYNLEPVLSQAVLQRLERGIAGEIEDTPKQGDRVFERVQTVIVADNAVAAGAAADKAAELGFDSRVLSTFIEGEASEVAKVAVGLAREVVVHNRPAVAPACLIMGGETTVTLRGDGLGGRNQELALAAALELDRIPEGGRIVLVSLATDGTDGPTDSAGGLVDSTTVKRGHVAGMPAGKYLAGNDAYPFLQAVGDMLITGPTQTNVNDLIMAFVF
ncbi:MAG: glycerate kinase [Chloroflexota bacterium]|nr:glycerate kinase [Chloroflexota bacterium]